MGSQPRLGKLEGQIVDLIDDKVICEAGPEVSRVTLLVSGPEEQVDQFVQGDRVVLCIPDHIPTHDQQLRKDESRAVLSIRRYRGACAGSEIRSGRWITHIVLAEHLPVPVGAKGKTAMVWEVRD